MLTSIELFTGAGGLALGLHQAGFHHVELVEIDRGSLMTLNHNRALLGLSEALTMQDAEIRDWAHVRNRIQLIAGGVPCQPFSLGGLHRGHRDRRNLFPAALRAIREVRPRVILIENVRGLTRPSFGPYFEYILRQIAMPAIPPKEDEHWDGHDRRLRDAEPIYARSEVGYKVSARVIQCADFGLPQMRERVFIVAVRNDLRTTWSAPKPTHSRRRLLIDQWVTGKYWEEHGLRQPARPARLSAAISQLQLETQEDREQRWMTVRDAIGAMPKATTAHDPWGHYLNPGARSYPGHEGSVMDWPAKTLKAGVHAVPGGENMLRTSATDVRYFTIREAARLQGFPDDYEFPGSWSGAFRQIGNAVPVPIAKMLGARLAKLLADDAAADAVVA